MCIRDRITIANKDSAAVEVTVNLVDSGGATTQLVKQTLNAGDSLHYEHARGWTFTTPTTAPFSDALPIVKGSADGTKQLRFEVDTITAQTTRTWTVPN